MRSRLSPHHHCNGEDQRESTPVRQDQRPSRARSRCTLVGNSLGAAVFMASCLFATQREAQQFFLSESGPNQHPHGLDADNDGITCASLST